MDLVEKGAGLGFRPFVPAEVLLPHMHIPKTARSTDARRIHLVEDLLHQ
jgi:hypothetical protein